MLQRKNKLYASIDVGSNSTLLLLGKFDEQRFVPLVEKAKTCRLGEDLHEGTSISERRISELKKILTAYRQTIHNLGAELKAVVMTEAVRRADNQDDVVQTVKDAIWQEPRIITGEEEARIGWEAVAGNYGKDPCPISIDVGGGSTELSNGDDFVSVPVGALKMTKKFGTKPGPELEEYLAECFAEVLESFKKQPVFLISGTATALGIHVLELSQFDREKIEGMQITLGDLDEQIARFMGMADDIRAQLPGLHGGRGEIIICGLRILRFVLAQLETENIRISTLGLRYGVLYQ